MLQQLEAKIKDLAEKLETSAANHNSLVGAMHALKELYDEAVKDAPVAEQVVEAVEAVV